MMFYLLAIELLHFYLEIIYLLCSLNLFLLKLFFTISASQDVAQDKTLLDQYEVTHILNLAYGVENAFEDDYNYKKLDILDEPSTDITVHFDECYDYIEEGIQRGNCLVHCNAGVSRCTTICCAYLMKKQKMKYTDALALVSLICFLFCSELIVCFYYRFVKHEHLLGQTMVLPNNLKTTMTDFLASLRHQTRPKMHSLPNKKPNERRKKQLFLVCVAQTMKLWLVAQNPPKCLSLTENDIYHFVV